MPAPTSCRGFTLIETIIVMVVVAFAAVAIAMMTGKIFDSQGDNKTLQVGMKLLEECAEQVLATRRATATGYSSLSATSSPISCGGNLQAFPGFNAPTVKSVAVTLSGTFPSGTPGCSNLPCGCPTGGSCKLVTIAVTTTGGDELSTVTLLLVGP